MFKISQESKSINSCELQAKDGVLTTDPEFEVSLESSRKFSFTSLPLFFLNSSDVWMLDVYFTYSPHITKASPQPGNLLVVLPLTSLPAPKSPDVADSNTANQSNDSKSPSSASFSYSIPPVAPLLAIVALSFLISCLILAIYMTRKKKQHNRLLAKQVVERAGTFALSSPSHQMYVPNRSSNLYVAASDVPPLYQPAPKRASALKNSSSNTYYTPYGGATQCQFATLPSKQATVAFSPQVTTIHDDTPTYASYHGGSFDGLPHKFFILESNA